MNLVRRFALLLVLAVGLAAPVARGQEVSGDLAKLQGTWVLASGSKDGKPLTGDELTRSRIVYKGAKFEVQSPHQHAETIRGTIKVGSAGNRKTLEWVRENGPDAGKAMIGIFEFRGNDEYVIVFGPAGKDVPREFASKPGSGHFMHVWRRAK